MPLTRVQPISQGPFKEISILPMEFNMGKAVSALNLNGTRNSTVDKKAIESEEDYKSRLLVGLKGAVCQTLSIEVRNCSEFNMFNESTPSEYSIELMNNIKFKELRFNSGKRNQFIPLMRRVSTILRNGHTSCKRVILDWVLEDTSEISRREKINELRKALHSLPALEELTLAFMYASSFVCSMYRNYVSVACNANPDHCVLNGNTFLNIVRKVERADLPTVSASPAVIVAALQIVRDSQNSEKFVKFSVPKTRSAALAAAIVRSGGKHLKTGEKPKAYLVDGSARMDVDLTPTEDGFVEIVMCKK